MEKEMTTSNCTVAGCTNQTHGRTHCATHRDQIRKGFTPGEAPDRYVDAGTVRPLLVKLREKHTVANLGRMIGCSPSRLSCRHCCPTRAAWNADSPMPSALLPVSTSSLSNRSIETRRGISGPETAEYAKTPEGLAFIAECRRPKARKAMAA